MHVVKLCRKVELILMKTHYNILLKNLNIDDRKQMVLFLVFFSFRLIKIKILILYMIEINLILITKC